MHYVDKSASAFLLYPRRTPSILVLLFCLFSLYLNIFVYISIPFDIVASVAAAEVALSHALAPIFGIPGAFSKRMPCRKSQHEIHISV